MRNRFLAFTHSVGGKELLDVKQLELVTWELAFLSLSLTLSPLHDDGW